MIAAVTEVERAAAATWPASTVDHVAGWLLRHCPLLRRNRSNSALPPPVVDDPATAVEHVERFYASRGSAPTIQVSPLHWHADLDAFLCERGYRAHNRCELLVAEADQVADPRSNRDFAVESVPCAAWVRACAAVGARVEPSLDRVPRPASFLVAVHNGQSVGVGLVVACQDWAGIYGMHTDSGWRRRGVARVVLHAAARWASSVGVKGLFLQVRLDNTGAATLYRQVGFGSSHGYHYRTADR